MSTSNEEIVSEGLLSIKAACVFAALSRTEIYRLMDLGELRYVKHGRRRMIPRKGLVEVLASRVHGGR